MNTSHLFIKNYFVIEEQKHQLSEESAFYDAPESPFDYTVFVKDEQDPGNC